MRTIEDPVAAEAVNGYLLASKAALTSAQALREAWHSFFRADGHQPSEQWISEVTNQQLTSDLALAVARRTLGGMELHQELSTNPDLQQQTVSSGSSRELRRRRPINKLLWKLGRRGQKILRAVLLVVILLSGLATTAAGISVAMEVAGYLRLIEDPVQLPLGIQLVALVAGAAVFLVTRNLLVRVERLLFGGKKSPSRTLVI